MNEKTVSSEKAQSQQKLTKCFLNARKSFYVLQLSESYHKVEFHAILLAQCLVCHSEKNLICKILKSFKFTFILLIFTYNFFFPFNDMRFMFSKKFLVFTKISGKENSKLCL